MHAPAALSKQVGPFPIGGWLAIGAAGVGIGLLLRRAPIFKSKPEKAMDLEGDGTTVAPGGVGGYVPAAGTVPMGNAPAGGGGGATDPSAGTTKAPENNLEWSRLAISWLIANGVNPNTADRAVRLYLEGQVLAIDEDQAISLLLRSPIGVPPEYVPPRPKNNEALPVAPVAAPTPWAPSPNPKMLVTPDDGDIAQFVSDGRTKEWVPDSLTAAALVKAGVAASGWAGQYPLPFTIPRSSINSLTPVGRPPDYGGQFSPAKTTW